MLDPIKNTPQEDVLAEQTRLQEVLREIIAKSGQRGASAAEVAANLHVGFSVTVRKGEVEVLEHHRDKGFEITVYFGQRKGSASSTDLRPESIEEALNAACNIAKYTNEDQFAGLAKKECMAFNYPNLDLYHPWNITPEQAIELAKSCEAKGFSYDPRIINTDGTSVTTHYGISLYANTHGFLGVVPASRHSISSVLIAKEGDSMQRDYSYTTARDAADLTSIEKIAQDTAHRTLRRLGARSVATCKVPVLFEVEVARGLLGSFISAISGGNLYRSASFLLDSLGKKVFPDFLQLLEQPHLKKALGSAPFDAEGVITREHPIIANGMLQSYVLDSYSARKLGMETTGNAGGVHNLIVATSDNDFAALIKRMQKGLVVTELLGQGVNIVTGDYSRGVSGFWVEHGEIQHAVEEITIAGNLKDMFLNIVSIGNDIDYRGNIRTGSILLEEMTLAGH